MLTITILTGARPALLADTLDSLATYQTGLLEGARVIALANGDDGPTREVLDRYGDVVDLLLTSPEILPIGPATSWLAEEALESGGEYWFHLEDDWRTVSSFPWVAQAVGLLDEVSQVRARVVSDRVLATHRVSRKPIVWKPRDGWRYSPHAHFTFNPGLIRVRDIPAAWPCTSEVDAMRRWLAAGHERVAQLDPGIFEHTGDQDSLRLTFGRE